jgi:hypothetical protein
MFISPPPLEASRILGPCIAEWQNVWKDTDSIIEGIETTVKNSPSVSFKNALVVGANGNLEKGRKRTNSDLSLSESAFQEEFFRTLNNDYFLTLLAATQWYKTQFDIYENFDHAESYNLLRYETGEEYKAHYDGGIREARSISPILYLNDDYEGGEIEFVNFGIKIKPKAGSLYIFPSTFPYAHIAHPVTEGTKYAIVTWLHEIPG